MNDDAQHIRKDLAACYRLVAHYGMTDVIYNHITAKLPGPEPLFLINGFGLHYDEVCASNLYTVNLAGDIVNQPASMTYGISRAGYVIHGAIHAAREDVKCIIHTHTRAGLAISAMKEGLMPLTQTAMRFHGRIAYHDYEGPAVDAGEQRRLVADLGPHNVMVLRNHGLLTCGSSIAEAFNLMCWLESACQAQVSILSMGRELTFPPMDVVEKTAHLYDPSVRHFGYLEWAALLRMLDRTDPSYQD
ncbi:class II aldolase/adducin family protein [Candidimonas nitroreducens]|uniref:Class II aldolase n=1 Tax=Candidimonas nitroreducens TaxID=683354 RepID=A0A225M4G3_9BURK|nr:class II aldolase/adducin family protein [Candidimonas nitroreducens]OWT56234.1 class II aldolase [Candidimonas nitroreducens]